MKNLQIPENAKILKIKVQNSQNKLYTLQFPQNLRKKAKLAFIPGQYVLVSVAGAGEAAFGLASSPFIKSNFEVAVQKRGLLTSGLDLKKPADLVGVRGPFGNGFPIEKMANKDIVMVAGGFGIAPLSALTEYLIKRRRRYQNIYLLYGAKTPNELLFKFNFKRWERKIDLCLTVEKTTKDWQGNVGMVTALCPRLVINPEKTIVIMTGPPIMYKFVIRELKKLQIKDANIYVSLESRLKCGIGKCQHCVIGKHYVCQDGPVFRFKEVEKDLKEMWGN